MKKPDLRIPLSARTYDRISGYLFGLMHRLEYKRWKKKKSSHGSSKWITNLVIATLTGLIASRILLTNTELPYWIAGICARVSVDLDEPSFNFIFTCFGFIVFIFSALLVLIHAWLFFTVRQFSNRRNNKKDSPNDPRKSL